MNKRSLLIEESKKLTEIKKILEKFRHSDPLLAEAFKDLAAAGRKIQEQIQVLKEN